MQFAYLEMMSTGVVRVTLATAAIFVALFTVVGPIGTHVVFTPVQRVVYCGVLAVFGLPVYYCLMVVTLYFTRFRSQLAATLVLVPVTAIGAVPVTAMSYVLHVAVYPDSPIPDLATLYLATAAAAVAACLFLSYAVFQRVHPSSRWRKPAVGGAAGAAINSHPGVDHGPSPPLRSADGEPGTNGRPTPQVPFLRRLPSDVQGQIIYLKTDSHYVRVHTTDGTSRLLLRFADAMTELAGLGMQVHRSYWVAHDQMLELVKHNNRTALRLTGDHEVPVSRTYLKSVQAALSA